MANLPPNLSTHDPYALQFRCWPGTGSVRTGRLAHYNLNAGSALVGSTLHDLNTVDSRTDVESITNPDNSADPTHGDSLENDDDTHSEDCVAQGYENSLQLQQVEAEQQMHLENDENPPPYGVLTYTDVIPIEAARARFVQLMIDRFIQPRFIAVTDSPEANYSNSNTTNKEKENKRKTSNEVHYEGDPRYLLPLTFIANLYETLVAEIDARLHTVEGVHEKTMGVALEASGGLYRKLLKKYPKSGHPMSFKRREMASALEAKTKFPQLVRGDEKRVRFMVIHGLELVERPEMPQEDAEWFKRLTGRHEAAVTARDYNYYSARVKHRRLTLRDTPPPSMPQFQAPDPPTVMAHSSPPHHQMQMQQQQQSRVRHAHQHIQQPQHTQQNPNAHAQHTSHTPPHVSRDIHSGMSMLVVPPPSPAKFCDQCGAAFVRETSRFCSECGTKRHGVP